MSHMTLPYMHNLSPTPTLVASFTVKTEGVHTSDSHTYYNSKHYLQLEVQNEYLQVTLEPTVAFKKFSFRKMIGFLNFQTNPKIKEVVMKSKGQPRKRLTFVYDLC
jgi:hypothetical protein